MNKNIFYLVGFPATGKTFFRKNMFLSDKYFIVSPDDIIEDMAKKQNITYNEAWKTVNFRDLYKQIQQNVNIAVQEGKHIVVDMTNLTVNARKRWKVPSFYKRYAIRFNYDKHAEACLKRRNKIGNKIIDFFALENMRKTNCPINESTENFIRVFNADEIKAGDWEIILDTLLIDGDKT